LLGGLWHGANWTFIVWGGVHGVALCINHLTARTFKRQLLPRWLAIVATFHIVAFAWVFFRAPDLATAFKVLLGLVSFDFSQTTQSLAHNAFPLALTAMFLAVHRFDRHARLRLMSVNVARPILLVFVGLCWILAIVVAQGSSAKFIYFDF
jgi:alginate O-acetyltransferase complex protein AlgI